MTHTPGPWIIDDLAPPIQISGEHPGGYGPHLIAECGGWISNNSKNDEANARLIAAAPELLEALMHVRLHLGPKMTPADINYVDAIIAKATAQ